MMKMNTAKIRNIKAKSTDVLRNIWAETFMTGMLIMGVAFLTALAVIITARLMGFCTVSSLYEGGARTGLFLALAAVILIISYFCSVPLYFGIRWYFWQAANDNVMPICSLFSCYASPSSVMRCVKLKLAIDLKRLAVFAVLSVPAYIEIRLARYLWSVSGQSLPVHIALAGGCAVVTLCLFALYLVLTARYIPVGYFLADEPDSSTSEIIEKSINTVKKKFASLMLTYLSFRKTILSALLIMPVIFLIPYFYIITALFIRECVSESTPSEDDTAVPQRKEQILV